MIVRSDGQSRRFKGKILNPTQDSTGYLSLRHLGGGEKGKRSTVHNLVCVAFHGARPSPDHEIAHWDGDKTNNRSINLRWASSAVNKEDALRLGRRNHGERHGHALLTESAVREIRAERASGTPLRLLADRFCVTVGCISNIANRRTWRHI
jgi:hypothetical protein